jgi:enoyl-CoA hydratase/carnithine racemase
MLLGKADEQRQLGLLAVVLAPDPSLVRKETLDGDFQVELGRGERITSQRAYELGLITEIVPHASLRTRALQLAGLVAAGSPEAIRVSRQAIYESLSLPLREAHRRGFVLLRAHDDHHPDAQEGPRAFLERREPRWTSPDQGL